MSIKPRMLITISGGLIDVVAIEGLDGVEIELVTIDYDTEGSGVEDGCVLVEGNIAFVSVGTVDTMSVDDAATARIARDTWFLT